MSHALLALSPLDGRYSAKLASLRPIFSEFGLMQRRVSVELHWLLALAKEPEISEVPAFSAAAQDALLAIGSSFSESDAARIKEIERTTSHDVKAVEYFIKEKFDQIKKKKELGQLICTNLQFYLETISPEVAADFFERLSRANNNKEQWPNMIVATNKNLAAKFIKVMRGEDIDK